MLLQLVPLILFAWFPFAILLFSKMTSARALIVGVLGGVMFLPMSQIDMPMIPGRKDVIINLGLLLAALIMDPRPLLAFRPRLVDAPVILLCVGAMISEFANGFPPYGALSALLSSAATYFVPYLLGRVFLNNVAALWQLAHGIIVAGLIYAPGCIVETLIGPVFHERVYGFPAFPDYLQSIRGSGFRPNMFMQHGLMVSTFMCCAAMMGFWLWQNKAFKRFFGLPPFIPVGLLFLVSVCCRSVGALLLMFVGIGVLVFTRYARKGLLVYVLAAIPAVYIFARTVGGWTGDDAVQLSAQLLGEDKGGSLGVRFGNENILVDRAMQKPVFGWAAEGDFLIKDFDGHVTSIPDGLWVIALGSSGLIGLSLLFASMVVPAVALLRRFPAKTWVHPAMAAPAALAIFLCTYAVDCLMNAMVNPIYSVALGAVAALSVAKNPMPQRSAVRRPQGRAQPMPQVSRRPTGAPPPDRGPSRPALPGRA